MIVIYSFSSRMFQFYTSKSEYVEQRPAMKWYLNVMNASSSALKRCMHGGDIWTYILLEISDHWKSEEAHYPATCRLVSGHL